MPKYVDINIHQSADTVGRRNLTVPKAMTIALTALWLATVIITARNGTLSAIYQPLIAVIVAATIVVPAALFKFSRDFRQLIEAIGHRRIVMFHIWRIPAALTFFWYGVHDMLPPAFWILAGVGDLLVGLYALRLSFAPQSTETYRKFHRFGFADFIVAVGTGLTFTLLMDERMLPVTTLPLALIPLFGVGISGASHLMAFDMLNRHTGFGSDERPVFEGLPKNRWTNMRDAWAVVAHAVDLDPLEEQSHRITALAKRVDALETSANTPSNG